MKKVYSMAEGSKNGYLNGSYKSKSPKHEVKKPPVKNMFERAPAKHAAMSGINFSSKNQKKSIQQYSAQPFNNTDQKRYRNRNLQPQELLYRYDVSNVQEFQRVRTVSKIQCQQQFFGLSLKKVSDIKSKVVTTSINSELNEVSNMIKEEKLKIGEKMKILKKNNDYYRQVCDGNIASLEDKATNTEQILETSLQKSFTDKQIQVGYSEPQMKDQNRIVEQQSSIVQKNADIEKEMENYSKLCVMLNQMNIDYKLILPDFQYQITAPVQNKEYKALTDAEVIKIQKFFIKKLISKLSK